MNWLILFYDGNSHVAAVVPADRVDALDPANSAQALLHADTPGIDVVCAIPVAPGQEVPVYFPGEPTPVILR